MKKYLIKESQLDFILEQSMGKVNFLKTKYPYLTEQDIAVYSEIDPTNNKEYLDFLIKLNIKYNNVKSNSKNIRKMLSVYHELKKQNSIIFTEKAKLNKLDKDINQYSDNKFKYFAETINEIIKIYDFCIDTVNKSQEEHEYILSDKEKRKYIKWLFEKYIAGSILIEDFYKYSDYIYYFSQNKNDANFKGPRDISGYDSLPHIVHAIREYLPKENFDERYLIEDRKLIENGEAELIGENDKMLVVSPLTLKASKFYGCTSEWCTLYSEKFKDYTSDGDKLYIVIYKNKLNSDSNERRVQLHLSRKGELGQIMNMDDESMSEEYEHDILIELLKINNDYFSVRIHPRTYYELGMLGIDLVLNSLKKWYNENNIESKSDFFFIISKRRLKNIIKLKELTEFIMDKLLNKNPELLFTIFDKKDYVDLLESIIEKGESDDEIFNKILSDERTTLKLIKKVSDDIENYSKSVGENSMDKFVYYVDLFYKVLFKTDNSLKQKFEEYDGNLKLDIKKSLLKSVIDRIKVSTSRIGVDIDFLNAQNLDSSQVYIDNKNIIDDNLVDYIKKFMDYFYEKGYMPINIIIYQLDKNGENFVTTLKNDNNDNFYKAIYYNLDRSLEVAKNDESYSYDFITSKLFVNLIDTGLFKKIPSKYKELVESYKDSKDPTVRRYYEYLKDYI